MTRAKAKKANDTYLRAVRRLVSAEHGERIYDADLFTMPSADGRKSRAQTERLELVGYLRRGWCLPDAPGQHMIELENLPSTEVAFRTAARLVSTLYRCYCEGCLDPHAIIDRRADDPANETDVALLEIRLNVAKANKLDTSGHPDAEAKIDAILKGEDREHRNR